MKKIAGTGASGGIARGRLVFFREHELQVERRHMDDASREIERFYKGRTEAIRALDELYRQSLERIGEKDSMIFQIHMMMLQDDDFSDAVCGRIKEESLNAEYAVWAAGQEFASQFSQMDNSYMRARATDVLDISRRLILCLDKEVRTDGMHLDEPGILAAEDLTPSETVQLDASKVLAILTRRGSKNSHSAILSRALGIPSVVGLKGCFDELQDGMSVIVDGSCGEVLLDPDEVTQKKYEQKSKAFLAEQQTLKELVSICPKTNDGRQIEVNANIGSPSDCGSAIENGANGIGLFRSEFLYMQESLPSEDEQYEAYKTVLERMQGRPVIIRTFDIGADKQAPCMHLPKEENPALGYRAIRIGLDQTELLCTQLRALFRASISGCLKIMFPMIISEEELRNAKQLVEQVKADLTADKRAFSPDVKIGIMVETPAAVMMSEELAKECDFFSIGTNDLTQYTLATDRMNERISQLYNPRHPAVLKMIEITVQNAKKAGIPVGICGESAADLGLTEFYLKAGVDELSVSPPNILKLKKEICCLNLSHQN